MRCNRGWSSARFWRGHPINVVDPIKMECNFTLVDDIVESALHLLDVFRWESEFFSPTQPVRVATTHHTERTTLITHQNVVLTIFIKSIDDSPRHEVKKKFLSLQSGNVVGIFADIGYMVASSRIHREFWECANRIERHKNN